MELGAPKISHFWNNALERESTFLAVRPKRLLPKWFRLKLIYLKTFTRIHLPEAICPKTYLPEAICPNTRLPEAICPKTLFPKVSNILIIFFAYNSVQGKSFGQKVILLLIALFGLTFNSHIRFCSRRYTDYHHKCTR